ncbi:Thioredoxin domain-containing protein [Allomuricauda ruestringensis DSM 13258]|uniref:Thioredoxin domain-containing protein n=1 Tax=Allomuricauda ruestringensis (strain DSM 13258 / CIP 107369 / LMG 19739 / B1) TaxID=886377 RepID=G2PJS1_ALLRU|nr:thioredoxin family protein [Allomuricauda ruestringensis]AEM69829.1 Thioredoxin domain-containing protein [Allomuricauda ruestringensis DSM 13258]
MKQVLTALFMLCIFCVSAQEFNKEITTENGLKFLVGQINLEGLQSQPYGKWFQTRYNNYTVDETMASLFKEKLAEYNIKLFLGTWCGDSKRESPRFIKILEAADFPMEQLEIIALDYRKGLYKTSPTGEEKGLNIIKVPTIIFFKDGKEVNRIVESPLETLEEDMAQIVFKKDYVPNYAY